MWSYTMNTQRLHPLICATSDTEERGGRTPTSQPPLKGGAKKEIQAEGEGDLGLSSPPEPRDHSCFITTLLK